MACSLFAHCPCTLFRDPWEVGTTWLSLKLTSHCGMLYLALWLWSCFLSSQQNLHSATHPKSGLCIFTHCSTHSKTFSCSVSHLCEVTWSTSGNGRGKVRAQWAWSVGVSLRTRLSFLLSLPYSLQWSSAGTLIPTLKRIVFSQFLIKV